ncbi:hypothetical protein AB5J49_24485 [Streptomyces sp. R28]|uniref:Uncharacterized protein n=1 Tax=Streptomyces sp. R28 TaxID=3238628 RepID=A0AB39Q541_9ACTN
MTDLVRRLVTWTSLLLMGQAASPGPMPSPPGVLPVDLPRHLPPPLPPHRSPYAHDDTPLDASAVRSVRPYLTADEQRQRRRELAIAALGQDMPGPYWIHGLGVA